MTASFLQNKILLSRLKAKDPEAFAELYDGYASRIYRFIYFKVSSVVEAQDLTAEVFLKTWQYLSNEENAEIKNLNAWLYHLARNVVIDWYRKQNKQPLALDEQAEEAAVEETTEKINLNWEMEQVTAALRQLKDEYREVLVMRYLDELEIVEIAKALEKSRGAVRVLIHRALRALQELVDKQNHVGE
jgi:RNA polymerase sigma-70 factor (ECF subfamily)